jgi:hypothetical protein
MHHSSLNRYNEDLNTLSLVGMQLPEKYKNFDEGPSFETSKFSLYFSLR